MQRAARFLFGCLVSLAIFCVAGELLTRQLAIIDRLNGIPRLLYLATNIPDLPYRLRPGVTIPLHDFTVRVNPLGLRGPDTTPQPAPGRRRLLFLGDSVVYGEGLEQQDTLPTLLETALNDGRRTPTEVLNAAAPGYNTEAELAFLRELGLSLAPDGVILGVSLNDYGPAPGLTPFGFLTANPADRTALPWLSNHSEFYMLLRWTITYARGGLWYQHAKAAAPPPAAKKPETFDDKWPAIDRGIAIMHKKFYAAPSGAGWDSVRRSLAALRDLTRARGLPLWVVIFPEKDQIELPQPNLDPQRQWLALCTEVGVHCLDLQPAFAAAASQGSLFQDTQHPNAAGMRIAAPAVAAFVADGAGTAVGPRD